MLLSRCNDSDNDTQLIHLDVADAIHENTTALGHLETSLFELAIFGCIPHPFENFWFFQGSHHIAVELSTGCIQAMKITPLVRTKAVLRWTPPITF